MHMNSNHEQMNNPYAFTGRRRPVVMRGVLIALFVLSFFSLPAGLALVATNQSFSTEMTDNMWMFFLMLPIPLANLILGVIYKIKGLKTIKNIVVGIIFTFLICIYGSFTFMFTGAYSHDLSYIDSVAAEIHFSLPDKGHISIQKLGQCAQNTSKAQASSDSFEGSFHYDTMSTIEFTDKEQISAFQSALQDSKFWATSIPTPVSSIIPLMYSIESSGFNYYLVYNVDLDTYNTLPEKSGTYRFIYIAYNSIGNKMVIGEYSDDVVLQ